ncbi:MAG: DUF106 domain-containing protein [Halobacteriaceae archaeon]
MARTAETVRELVREDEEMEEVLETVLDRSSDGDTALAWDDVSDTLSSGQWGRLIETGLLEDGDDGFVIADPDGIREALSTPDIGEYETELPEKDLSWSRRDKIAGVLTLSLIPAYTITEIRDLVGSVMNVILGPLLDVMPFWAVILVLATATGLYSALLQDNMVDMDVIGAYQARMQEVQDMQEEAKERGDEDAVEAARQEQMEAMGENLGMFKEQFRPFVYIMLLTIPAFVWMYWIMGAHTDQVGSMTFALLGDYALQQTVLGPVQGWLLWYFVCSLAFSNLVRKLLDVQTTPDV